MIAVMVFGVVGYLSAGWNLSDSIYMVVISIFTVGYGEVRPIEAEGLRDLTMAIIVLGCFSVIFVSGALVQFLLAGQILRALGDRRMSAELKKLNKHVIICGYGRIGRMVAADLKAGQRPFVIIDKDERRLETAREEGYLTLEGEATRESVLIEAGIAKASVLATVLPSDASNVFITLSARDLNPELRIISRGEDPATERKLIQAGATRVVLPAHIGAERVSHLILFPEAEQLIDDSEKSHHLREDLVDLGLQMEESIVPKYSRFVGKTVADLESHEDGGMIVVALHRKDGGTELRPGREVVLNAGDGVVTVSRGSNLCLLLEKERE
ncbi:NAD-binding protein [Luteolibacter pohnpeiensis]|uniref:NAD-binding protein n=2 Tax=Luteolibacter pohnpeiensis TaxID=454153 RepID=A0A934VSP9_9BACT|nr:NAD-binding protein [Luteolibacter pohnpeiensis]